MDIDQIKTICVIGAGDMGHQISINAAIHGFDTWCNDVSQAALDKASAFAKDYFASRIAKGRLTQEQVSAAMAGLHFTSDLKVATKHADVVIEAVVEKLKVKQQLFAELDECCPSSTILATNSSFIVSSKLAEVTKRSDKVCNIHFFNPALVMKVVEIVRGPHTSEETVNLAHALCERLGKTPVILNKEIYGFIVNRFVDVMRKEAIFLVENGYASYQDVDSALEGALNYPLGPFRLLDFTGLDLAYDCANERYAETGDPSDKPSLLITDRVKVGQYGRKTGRGFYNYG
jgi:3-hydroxybutyryl-CoA dehydrogenase